MTTKVKVCLCLIRYIHVTSLLSLASCAAPLDPARVCAYSLLHCNRWLSAPARSTSEVCLDECFLFLNQPTLLNFASVCVYAELDMGAPVTVKMQGNQTILYNPKDKSDIKVTVNDDSFRSYNTSPFLYWHHYLRDCGLRYFIIH